MLVEATTAVAARWRRTTVGETGRYVNGVAFKPADRSAHGFPIIRIQNLTDPDKPLNRTTRKVDPIYRVEPGELLVSWSATLDVFIWNREPALLNQHIFKVVPNESVVDRRFLFYLLKLAISDMVKSEHLHGSTMKHINRGPFLAHGIAIPHLDEQRRIVAEIEKQFTRLDAGRAALERMKRNLKRYRAAVLKAACEGRLVPTEAALAAESGRPFEPASELLARILHERRVTWSGRGKYKEPALPDTANLSSLPHGWSLASVDQLCGHITSGSRDWSQFYGRGSGTFVLAQNVRPMRLDFAERQAVAAPKHDAETERTRVAVNDLLVTIVGARTGDVCRVPTELLDHFVCQSVALLRPIDPRVARFAEAYIASPENGQAQWKRLIYGQGRPHLSFEQLRITAIALPPLAEQHRIVAEVERRLSVVDELEALVTANLKRATRLRQSILQRAFSGELVPPASEAHVTSHRS
jgi:type I restriction enzyme S subunit